MSENKNVAIIGGGVIGLSIAFLLSKLNYSVILFEKSPYLANDQSGRNSGVRHAGIYYDLNSKKAELCFTGNRLLHSFCEKHGIYSEDVHKLIVASKEKEKQIDAILANAKRNGVSGTEKIYKNEIEKLEPNVSADVAIYSRYSGVLNAANYAQTLARLAKQNGAMILVNKMVTGFNEASGGIVVKINDDPNDEMEFSYVFNCAGLYADEVAKLFNSQSEYLIQPIRGEYASYLINRPEIEVKMSVYGLPQIVEANHKKYFSVGIHLSPTPPSLGNRKILVGPTAKVIDSKNDYESERLPLQYFLEIARKFIPNLREGDLSLDYVGIRAKISYPKDDFVIDCDSKNKRFINVMADSPGLTSSLRIAMRARSLLPDISTEAEIDCILN